MSSDIPYLSVIIPVLDEAPRLPGLLGALAAQESVRLQVVLADGGSRDGSPEVAAREARTLGLDLTVVATPLGRARQMNRAAEVARAPDFLFLHADSGLPHLRLLALGLAELAVQRRRLGHHRVAGHFGLYFQRSRGTPSRAYYFYEAKTRLNRPDCVRGDQGFLLAAAYFRELGGFDESLPYLEDARLAAAIGRTGVWVNLPGALATSARRFEVEGLRQRQILNAMLCNFDHIGLHGYLAAAADAYRRQGGAGRLQLIPFHQLAHRVMGAQGVGWRLAYWLRTGRYIAGNAWQLAFALDCRANQRDGWPPGEGPRLWLRRYQTGLRRALESAPCGLATALLTAAWSYCSLVRGRLCRTQ